VPELPGIEQRYTNNDEIEVKSPNRGRDRKGKGGSHALGQGATSGSEPLTPQQKLEAAGLTVEELKDLLGL